MRPPSGNWSDSAASLRQTAPVGDKKVEQSSHLPQDGSNEVGKVRFEISPSDLTPGLLEEREVSSPSGRAGEGYWQVYINATQYFAGVADRLGFYIGGYQPRKNGSKTARAGRCPLRTFALSKIIVALTEMNISCK